MHAKYGVFGTRRVKQLMNLVKFRDKYKKSEEFRKAVLTKRTSF